MPNRSSAPTKPIHGVYVALATPRRPNELEADACALLDYMDAITNAGVAGLLLFGITGEFIHYDVCERMRVLSLAIRRTRVPLVVNISHSSFNAAVDLAENAIETGASGILLMPPWFMRYSDNQIFNFYQEFVKTVDSAVPVYIYNVPSVTNPLSVDLSKRLLLTEAFAGMVDSSGEWPSFEAIQSVRDKVTIQNLAGCDDLYPRARAVGADGVLSEVAAAIPELMVGLDRAVVAKDSIRQALLAGHLMQFITYVNAFPATTIVKQAALARGWKQGHSAIPFDEATLAGLAEFRCWFEGWLPGVLADSVRT